MTTAPFTGYIYTITNLVDGKTYVGLTILVDKRWGEHKSACKNGSQYPLHRAMHKHGVHNFVVECVETVLTSRADLIAAEIRHIAARDCLAPRGYNLTPGGEGVDLTVPGVHERMIEGARRRSAGTSWQRNVAEAAKKRAEDPLCQERLREGVRRRSATPEWQKNVVEGSKKRVSDPAYSEACSRGAQAKLSDPEWRKQNLEQLRTQHANSDWQKARNAGAQKSALLSAARATARDAHLPLEKQVQRAKRREADRLRQAEKRARKTPTEST